MRINNLFNVFKFLPSGRAGLVAATQLRPALVLHPIYRTSTLGPALVKAAYAATGCFFLLVVAKEKKKKALQS